MQKVRLHSLQISVQELENELKNSLHRCDPDSVGFKDCSESDCASAFQVTANVTSFKLRQQVADSMFKRSNQNIEAVYRKYAKDQKGVCQDDFFNACQEVRFDFTSREDTDELFINMDMNDDSFLDLSDFRRAMGARSASEQFILQTVPLHEVVSSALPRKYGRSPLDAFRELNRHEIAEIAQVVSGVLETILIEKVSKLKESWEAAKAKEVHDGQNEAKFFVVELKAGSIQDYHNGLSGRVGEENLSSCVVLTDCYQNF
jgi:hypothetical protein